MNIESLTKIARNQSSITDNHSKQLKVIQEILTEYSLQISELQLRHELLIIELKKLDIKIQV